MPEKENIDSKQVKQANRILYDAAAENYEALDGRRSKSSEDWLKGKLSLLRDMAPGGMLLDIGAGSGFVARCAKNIFDTKAAIDISPRILAVNKSSFDFCAVADADYLPFKDSSFDAVTCFAALHHFLHFDLFVKELARILKPGGGFYSDHDMDKAFYNRFKMPLKLYRAMRSAKYKYRKESSAITEEIYEKSEIHEDGIDTVALINLFEDSGFSVKVSYHWQGLNPVSDLIFKGADYSRGFAPLVSMMAKLANKTP